MKNSKVAIALCSLLSVAVTVIFYLLIFDNIFTVPMQWISLLCMLLSEVMISVKLLFIKINVLTQGSITAGIIHLAVVLCLSVVFVNFFPLSIRAYILLNILFFCVLCAADIMIYCFSRRFFDNEKSSDTLISQCILKMQEISINNTEPEYTDDIKKIIDKLEFSDISVATDDEEILLKKINLLKQHLAENEENEIIGCIREITEIIDTRSFKLKQIKRGKI